MLPKKIHFVWVDHEMPDWVQFNIAEFKRLNPGHQIFVHGDEILLPEYASLYSLLTESACKSDLLRLCALKQHGGWYFDTDFWAFRPVDDIERAYRLDGSRLFLAKQEGNMNPDNTIANGIMAIGEENTTIDELLAEVMRVENPCGLNLGPELVKKYNTENKHKVILGDGQWFFPSNYHDAVSNYERIQNGYCDIATTLHFGTGGQQPFVMHLWAGGNQRLINNEPDKTHVALLNPNGRQTAGLILNQVQADLIQIRPDHPMRRLADGLANLGYRVEVRTEDSWPCFTQRPDLIAVWNGMREPLRDRVAAAEREGIPVYRVEHGWFQRKIYHQCDRQGFLHWSSIVKQMSMKPPAAYKKRFEQVWGSPVKPVRINKNSNKILVIGQTAGDTQLAESEIVSPMQIDMAVCRAIDGLDLTAEFRPHPLDKQYYTEHRKKFLPTAKDEPLEEAIAKARFVVTINSNAGVEALAHGCPVLCFGPATYEQAGVAWRTTKRDLRMNIININDFVADQSLTENYLHWLAGNQYSLDEFSMGIPFQEVA